MGVSKIVVDGSTLADVTGDTVTPDTLADGYTACDKSGNTITGSMKPKYSPVYYCFDSNNGSKIASGSLYFVKYGPFVIACSNELIGAEASRTDYINNVVGTLPSAFRPRYTVGQNIFDNQHIDYGVNTSGSVQIDRHCGVLGNDWGYNYNGFTLMYLTSEKSGYCLNSKMSTWAWSSSNDAYGEINSDSYIKAKRMGPIVNIWGDVVMSHDHTSDDTTFFTIADIPSEYRPPKTWWCYLVKVIGTSTQNPSEFNYKSVLAVTPDGKLKAKSVADTTSGFLVQKVHEGMRASRHYIFSHWYPVEIGSPYSET